MKKIVNIMLVAFVFMLCACNKSEENDSKYNYTIYERPGIEFYTYDENYDDKNIVLLKNYNEYKNYVETIILEDVNDEFREGLKQYNENFFQKDMLIVINHWEETGASKLSINDIVYNENHIEVILKCLLPDKLTGDEIDYAILIKIPRDDTYSTIEYSVIEESEKKWYEFW